MDLGHVYKPDGEALVDCDWGGNGHQYLRMNSACDAFDSDGNFKIKFLCPAGVWSRAGIRFPGCTQCLFAYPLWMPAISQIEASIQELPAQEFFTLLGWMAERHLEVLSSDEFEAPEVEIALLKSLDGARHPVTDALFAGIRARAVESKP